MGLPSVLIAYITVYIQDAAAVKMHGFFGGYNTIVWTVIIVQAVGGLIVATVVKVCLMYQECFSKKRYGLKYFLSFCPHIINLSFTTVRGQRVESLCDVIFYYYFMYHISILL